MRQHLNQMPKFLVKMNTLDLGQAEKIAPLTNKNDHADAGGEAHDDRCRNELDHPAHARYAHQGEDDPGHERCYLQTIDTICRSDACQDGNEGTGGPGDLHATATQERDQ